MSEFEWLNDLADQSAEQLGVEKVEELLDASEKIAKLFRDDIENSLILSTSHIVSSDDYVSALATVLATQFTAGASMYRELMLKHRVNVSAIEDKELAERK